MSDRRFLDVSRAATPDDPDYWEPVIYRRDDIDAEVERLSSSAAPPGGRRESLLVHPRATEPGLGLAPGIRVSVSVLLPGESTAPMRHNSSQVNFCIAGGGLSVIGDREVRFERYDLWNTPSYRPYQHINDTSYIQVRLTYSNAPVLEKLHVHLVEELDSVRPESPVAGNVDESENAVNPFGSFALSDGISMMMPYEKLIDPPTVRSEVLHWPWEEVRSHLDKLESLGPSYVGRRLYLLHNPMTGRTNGTTPSFFATMTLRPAGIVDRPHRHVSAAINYFFHGSGWSRVGGRRYEWAAGDLMFTAPGWMVHNHASDTDDIVYELTIQDQPFHIANESLLWQEDLKRPRRLLGVEPGFATNRSLT